MIITVTLAPALEVVHQAQIAAWGEDCKAERSGIFAGGNGIHISRCLQALQIASFAMLFSGGETGALLTQLLDAENIDYEAVTTGAPVGVTTGIYTPTGSFTVRAKEQTISPREGEAFLAQFSKRVNMGDCVVIAGPTPPGLSPDYYEKLAEITKGHGAFCVGDSSGQGLFALIRSGVFLIRIDQAEACRLFGIRVETPKQGVELCRKIHDQGVNTVLLTLEGQGTVYSTDKTAYYIRSLSSVPQNDKKEQDSFVAGFVGGMGLGLSPAECLKMAVACAGAQVVTSPFDRISRNKVLEWAGKIELDNL